LLLERAEPASHRGPELGDLLPWLCGRLRMARELSQRAPARTRRGWRSRSAGRRRRSAVRWM